MSTVKALQLRKGLPYQIRVRSNGNWDSVYDKTYESNGTLTDTAVTYNGLSSIYGLSYQSADFIDFSETVLPWKYEYSTSLSTSKFCLMPAGFSYQNIEGVVYTYNFNVIGTPTIDNNTKVASGFSNSNYIELSNPFTGSQAPWEIVVPFLITQTQSGYRDVFSSMAGVSGVYAGVTLGLNSNKFYLQLGLTSSSYETITADFNASTNTKYWLKATWSGSVYGFSYSTDGQNYTSIGTVNSTSALYRAEKTRIGVYGNAVDHVFANGSIYLQDMYIKVNGSDWFVPTFTPSSGTGTTETLPGVTYNYVDDGSAMTLNCFTEQFDKGVVLTPDNSYSSNMPALPMSGTWLGDLTFTEIATTNDWDDEDNLVEWRFDITDCTTVGTPTIDDNDVSDFSTSDYVISNPVFNPGNHFWEFCGLIYLDELKTQVFAKSNGFEIGLNSNNKVYAKFFDAEGQICELIANDYVVATNTPIQITVFNEEWDGDWIYELIVNTWGGAQTYEEYSSTRHILPGRITFGVGYSKEPQRLLGTVSIPSHTAYDYDNGTWTAK